MILIVGNNVVVFIDQGGRTPLPTYMRDACGVGLAVGASILAQ
jgi:hypothetical protein